MESRVTREDEEDVGKLNGEDGDLLWEKNQRIHKHEDKKNQKES